MTGRWLTNSEIEIAKPLLGTASDSKVADRLSEMLEMPIHKSRIQKMRTRFGVEAFGGSHAPTVTKDTWRRTLEARERGYSSAVLERLWAENRDNENLLYTWKRSERLREFIR